MNSASAALRPIWRGEDAMEVFRARLFRYAGQEAAAPLRRVRVLPRSHRAYMMFRSGKDTLAIAEHYRIRECTVLRWISQERSKRRGLADPYECDVAG